MKWNFPDTEKRKRGSLDSRLPLFRSSDLFSISQPIGRMVNALIMKAHFLVLEGSFNLFPEVHAENGGKYVNDKNRADNAASECGACFTYEKGKV